MPAIGISAGRRTDIAPVAALMGDPVVLGVTPAPGRR